MYDDNVIIPLITAAVWFGLMFCSIGAYLCIYTKQWAKYAGGGAGLSSILMFILIYVLYNYPGEPIALLWTFAITMIVIIFISIREGRR